MTSIDQARANVQQATRAVLTIADAAAPTSAASVELRLWSGLLALGRALMALFFARQAAAFRAGRSYEANGHRFKIVGTETGQCQDSCRIDAISERATPSFAERRWNRPAARG